MPLKNNLDNTKLLEQILNDVNDIQSNKKEGFILAFIKETSTNNTVHKSFSIYKTNTSTEECIGVLEIVKNKEIESLKVNNNDK